MADTLKFGPEWLRALSDGTGGGSVTSPPQSPATPVYKLAEHRYGREEMLALMTGSSEPPSSLVEHPQIFVEQLQPPLAYKTASEDEQRMISQCVNSSLVLRLMGRTGPDRGMERGPGAPFPSNQGPPSRGMGRPMSERGRGRGRGRGDGGFFGRAGPTEDGGGDQGLRRGFQRSESMEERDKRFLDRGFGPRGMNDDDGGPPPRREFSRSMSNDNWRAGDREPVSKQSSAPFTNGDSRGGDDEEDGGGWRRAGSEKWGRGSWRDRHARQNEDGDYRSGYRHHRGHDDPSGEDGLPEWSTEDIGDGVGTFDASGAFLSESKNSPRDMTERDKRSNDVSSDSGARQGANKSSDRLHSMSASDKDLSVQSDSAKKSDHPRPARATKSLEKPPSKVEARSETSESQISPGDRAGPDVNRVTDRSNSDDVTSRSLEEHVINSVDEHPAQSVVESVLNTADDDDIVDQTVGRTTATTTSAPSSVRSGYHADDQWYYKDPQGEVQGPFGNANMTEWFTAGYFTMNLLVKREQDAVFCTLGDLIKQFGRVPFIRSSTPDVQHAERREPVKPVPEANAPLPKEPVPVSVPGAAPVAPGSVDVPDLLAAQRLLAYHQQAYHAWQMQLLQQMQKNEKFVRLPPAQQNQLLMQLMAQPPAHIVPPQPGLPLNPADPIASILRAQQQPQQPAMMTSQPSSTSPATSTPSTSSTSSSSWQQLPQYAQSVWNLPVDKRGQTEPGAEDTSRRLEAAMAAQEVARMEERRRDEEDRRRKLEEEEEKLRELERARVEEQERLRAIERQRELEEEKERERQLERQQQLELERRREQEERERKVREEEDRRKREEEIERQRQEETKRREDLKKKRQDEQRRQEELARQQAIDEENKRQMEIQRRQLEFMVEMQRQQEIKRHQQEAMKRLQEEQEQLSVKLPSSARWGAQAGKPDAGSSLTLTQIQHIQEEKERAEREEAARQRALQAQQAVLQSQTAPEPQYKPSWNSPTRTTISAKSLMEIQEEQARQLERDQQKKHQNQVTKEKVTLATAAVWGGNHARWAQDGAWGQAVQQQQQQQQKKQQQQLQKQQQQQQQTNLGFWDDAVNASNKRNAPTPANSNSQFPSLFGNNNKTNNNQSQSKNKTKQPKDEDCVQRLFHQVAAPKDEFTCWCNETLASMQTSVDVPTFIAFLLEVDSPYEVHDYIRSYLGESRDAANFAKDFIERRSKLKNRGKAQSSREDNLSGPAPAVSPREHVTHHIDDSGLGGKKTKKQKMQKLDASILGFSVHASENRVNIGEIEKPN